MTRNTKMIVAALAAALVTTLGVAAPASAGPVDKQRSYTGGGGWCC